MRIDWLRVAHEAAVPFVELPGWRGRGASLARCDAVVVHATITPATWSDQQVGDLLFRGRLDLAGPLGQGVDRSGRFWIVADGKCNHNGYGRFGNESAGLELFLAAGEHPTPAQYATTVALCGAMLRLGLVPDIERLLGHKETDPVRKSDVSTIDMGAFRDAVLFGAPAEPPTPVRPQEDEVSMMTDEGRRSYVADLYLEHLGRWPEDDGKGWADEAAGFVFVGASDDAIRWHLFRAIGNSDEAKARRLSAGQPPLIDVRGIARAVAAEVKPESDPAGLADAIARMVDELLAARLAS